MAQIAQYIFQNPEATYEVNGLFERFGIHRYKITKVISSLVMAGVLDSQSGFISSSIMSHAAANDITSMLYEEVLLPAQEVAVTLKPPHTKPLDAKKLRYFLQNYQQERSERGPEGGQEVREGLVDILMKSREPMKLSHIREEYNGQTDRRLSGEALQGQLKNLTKQGRVKHVSRGYYTLA